MLLVFAAKVFSERKVFATCLDFMLFQLMDCLFYGLRAFGLSDGDFLYL